MDIRDITKEQFETLILLRSLEAFITDEYEDLSNLSEVVCNFADNQDTEEFNRLRFTPALAGHTSPGAIAPFLADFFICSW